MSGLEQSGKCGSNGSLISQNGIKYSSEPELQKKVNLAALKIYDIQ